MRVRAQRVFPNCPRYIHRMALVERSAYVPRAGVATPVPDWKRGPLAAGVLPAGDPATQACGCVRWPPCSRCSRP